MRHYIFTDEEKQRLTRWLETGEENQTTLNLFTVMRQSTPNLIKDMKLLIRVSKRLQTEKRWRGRLRAPPDFKSSLLQDESE